MKTTATLLLTLLATPALAQHQRLETATLRDPGMQDMESHTLLVPQGWTLAGGVVWTPEIQAAYVHVDADITAPDGRQASFHPSGSFNYFETSMAMPRPRAGQVSGGKVFLSPGRGPEDYLLGQLMREQRPKARGVRVESVSEMEELANTWRQLLRPLIESQEALNAMNRQMGTNAQFLTTVRAPVVRVRYRENGTDWQEDFSLLFLAFDSSYDDGWGTWYRNTDWSVYDVKSVRAPAGRLDESTPLLRTVAGSLRTTRRWQAMIDQLNAYLLRLQQETHRVTMREIQKRGRIMAETSDQIMEMQRESWESTQASNDRLAHAWSNSIRGVDDYELPDGTTWSLESGYDNVFTDQAGSFLFTNDHLADPNVGSTVDWVRIEPIRPMGGAANR